MAKVEVKRETTSPSPAVRVKEEEPNSEVAAAVTETVAAVSDAYDEISDTEIGDRTEQKPLSHQQAMEHFKDALAEIVVVCKMLVNYGRH